MITDKIMRVFFFIILSLHLFLYMNAVVYYKYDFCCCFFLQAFFAKPSLNGQSPLKSSDNSPLQLQLEHCFLLLYIISHLRAKLQPLF